MGQFLLIPSKTTYERSLLQPCMSCYLCQNLLSQKCLDKRREHVEQWYTSKRSCRKHGLASMNQWGRRWSTESFLQMKLLEMVVIEGSVEGMRARPTVGQKNRGDLPVCFRCGKCWLPIDSIRASSGADVKGWGRVRKREESKKKRSRRRSKKLGSERRKRGRT